MLRRLLCAISIGCLSAVASATPPQGATPNRGGMPTLPTLAEVNAVLRLDDLKPKGQETGVFVSRGALSYTTTESMAAVSQRVHQQLVKQGWRAGASRSIEMQSITFMKDERPATIMVYSATEPNKSIVQRYSWQHVDLSALTELSGASQLSRTKSSLQYAVPFPVKETVQMLHKKLKAIAWPVARTSETHGTITDYAKNGHRCTGQVTRMSNHEFEMKPGGSTTTTSVYVMSGPHVDVDALPAPNLVERLAEMGFSGGQTKAYLAKGDPKSVAKACRAALQKQNWTPVVPIRGGMVEVQELYVQKGCLLQLRVDSAQAGMSEVNYHAMMVPFDLPANPVQSIRIDSASPHLSFVTTTDRLDELTSFYEDHLANVGWTINASQRLDSARKRMRTFRGTHYQPVLLEVQRKGPNETWVELRPVDPTQLAALLTKAKEGAGASVAAEQIASKAEANPVVEQPEVKLPDREDFEAELAQQLQQAFRQAAEGLEGVENKEAKEMLADLQQALSAANGAAGEEATAGLRAALAEALPNDLGDVLSQVAGAQPESSDEPRPAPEAAAKKPLDESHGVPGEKFPIPRDARKLKRQPDLQSISYYTTKVGPHAAFFARELKQLGFRPRGEREIEDDFAFMRFQKGNGTVQISMFADERNEIPVRVMINGDGLLWPGTEDELGFEAEDVAADETSEDNFDTPEEHAGIPLPDRLMEVQTSGSPFLAEATGTKKATLASLVEFYRKELPARGWKEVKARTVVTKEKVQMVFATSDAHVGIQVEQFGDEVDFKIRKRDAKKAKTAGVIPARGMARIVLVNTSEHDAKLTIGNTTVAIAAGVGMRDPSQGKKFDVAPGTHRFTIEVQGEKQQDQVKVSAGGAWAIVVAPEIGNMADRVY